MDFKLIGERLALARKKKEMTLEDVGNIFDVHKSTVLRWENGETEKVSTAIIEKLANVYSVNLEWLIGLDVPMQLESPTITPVVFNKEDMIKMPVLGRIPAGIAFDAIEDIETHLYIHKDRVKETPEDYFLLKIDGDSMSPKYENEDVILFEKSSTANNGQDVAIMVNGYDATFKTIYRYEDRVELKPINQQYQVQVFNNKEIEDLPITILGIAKSLEYRKL